MKSKYLFLILIIPAFVWHCDKQNQQTMVDEEYVQTIKNWHTKRIASLEKSDGWLTLAGLFWLKEGPNTFGSSESNDIVFPRKTTPGTLGTILLKDNKISIKIDPDAEVLHEQQRVDEQELMPDAAGKPTIIEYGSLSWYIIKRGTRYGVRLKDSASPNLTNFKGIETFPIKKKWRVQAELEPYNPPKTIAVPNVLGDVSNESCPGALVFKIDKITYRLDPIAESDSDEYFIIFADDTNGDETYGAGRFLYVNAADSTGHTWIDFNKAYYPPCAFTEFATCPLPPLQNRLPVKITAGEKNYGGSGH